MYLTEEELEQVRRALRFYAKALRNYSKRRDMGGDTYKKQREDLRREASEIEKLAARES